MAYYGRRYSGGLQADPSFQLGMALGNAYGNMWAANAKKRQAKQLDDYIEEQRNADFMNEVNAMQTPVSGQERLINEARQVSNPSYDLPQGSTPILDRIDKYNQNGIDRAIDNIVKADSQGAINFMQKQEGMSELDRAKQRYKNLDVDSVTAWAKKNGINQEVLDERLPALQKELASNIGGLMTKEITNNLYSGDMNKIITGIQQLDELEKYAPERAKELRRAGEAARVNTMNFNNQLKLANMRAGNKPVYRISDSALKNYSDELKILDDKMVLLQDGQELSPQEQARYNWLSDMLNYGQAERSYSLGMHQPNKQLPQEQKQEVKPNRPAQNLFESWWNEFQLFPNWEQNENGLKQKLANINASDIARLAREKDRERLLAMGK